MILKKAPGGQKSPSATPDCWTGWGFFNKNASKENFLRKRINHTFAAAPGWGTTSAAEGQPVNNGFPSKQNVKMG